MKVDNNPLFPGLFLHFHRNNFVEWLSLRFYPAFDLLSHFTYFLYLSQIQLFVLSPTPSNTDVYLQCVHVSRCVGVCVCGPVKDAACV